MAKMVLKALQTNRLARAKMQAGKMESTTGELLENQCSL